MPADEIELNLLLQLVKCSCLITQLLLFIVVCHSGSSRDLELFQFAKLVGTDWSQLAVQLGFTEMDVKCYEADLPTNQQRSKQVVFDWYYKSCPDDPVSVLRAHLDEARKNKRDTGPGPGETLTFFCYYNFWYMHVQCSTKQYWTC